MEQKLYRIPTISATIGKRRGLIIDSLNDVYYIVPNDLIKFIQRYNSWEMSKIKEKEKENIEVVDEYVSFLTKINSIIWLHPKHFDRFVKNYNFESNIPNKITNAIVDFNGASIQNIEKVINLLNDLNIINVQFRIFKLELNNEITSCLINHIENSSIWHVEILVNKESSTPGSLELLSSSKRISYIITDYETEKYLPKLNHSKCSIDSEKSCGNICTKQFNTSYRFLAESKSFNTCLNRKLSIDAEGNIKNCPSMAMSYGNINDPDVNIEAIVNSEEFQKVWYINKDKINICKVCEFRHVCTDCRAYLEDPEDIYSKPLKCGYNPYTTEWEEWSTHPMKQKAIDYYGMREIIKT
jgi:SPASM domain peptide maturase of grasp-with-spasm system